MDELKKKIRENKPNVSDSSINSYANCLRHLFYKAHLAKEPINMKWFDNVEAMKEELKDANTVICEQVNAWLNNFKFILKHMNRPRYVFFLSIILREFNTIKLDGKYNMLKRVTEYNSFASKRLYDD